MSGLLIVFLFWAVLFGIPVGWGLAKIESKVNHTEPRTRNAILWSVFLGPIGWIWVVARSNLKFASTFSQNQRVVAEAARQQLSDRQAQEQLPPAAAAPPD